MVPPSYVNAHTVADFQELSIGAEKFFLPATICLFIVRVAAHFRLIQNFMYTNTLFCAILYQIWHRGARLPCRFFDAFCVFYQYFTANVFLRLNNIRISHKSVSGRHAASFAPSPGTAEPGLNRRNRTSAGETGPRGQRTSFFCYACRSPFSTGSHGEIPTYFCRRLSTAPAISKEFYHLWQKN